MINQIMMAWPFFLISRSSRDLRSADNHQICMPVVNIILDERFNKLVPKSINNRPGYDMRYVFRITKIIKVKGNMTHHQL